MNRLIGVANIHYKDKWSWLYLPYIILFSSFIINLLIAVVVNGRGPIYTGGLSSIYVYTFVVGIISLTHTFPFALGLSVRRTDFFWGTAIMIALSAGFSALLLFIFSIIENDWTGGWGYHLHFFNLPYLNDGPLIEQLWIYYIFLIQMYFLGFSFSSIYRRLGRNGMFAFATGLSLLLTLAAFVCTRHNWWGAIGGWLSHQTAFELSLWMLPLIAIYMLFSYRLLRRATV